MLSKTAQQDLIQLSAQARLKAYAPYSHFKVGAALLCKDGVIFQGCNVENASYGLCNCAERTAFFSAVAAGYQTSDFLALAVIADTKEPVSPCGACRQVMLELGGAELQVILSNTEGQTLITNAGALLPGAFQAQDLPI
jgi:cytidine deaminase